MGGWNIGLMASMRRKLRTESKQETNNNNSQSNSLLSIIELRDILTWNLQVNPSVLWIINVFAICFLNNNGEASHGYQIMVEDFWLTDCIDSWHLIAIRRCVECGQHCSGHCSYGGFSHTILYWNTSMLILYEDYHY